MRPVRNLFQPSLYIFQLLILFILCGEAAAQQRFNLNLFDGIRSEGPMPADMRLSLEELYTLDKQRVREYNDGRLRNRDRVLTSSYQIHRMMTSGRVLYGDPITRMVEGIADTLLKDYPTLRTELRFYTLKSPEVNAFATGQGMIFVCTGLVAQVEDEAQLAFIISHEVIHYFRKHSLEEISRGKHDSDDIDAETQEMRDFIKYHNRSREMEHEADSLGLTMFYLNSPYSKDVIDGVFDVLQYGYLPFDERPFDTSYFNTRYFKLPDEYFMEKVDPISARDDYNDSLSTHPNILKRRQSTASIIGDSHGGSPFVTLSKEKFEEIRALARFECVRQDLIHAEYSRAFYDCFLLQRLYPDNAYVERSLCQALYGLSKYKTYTNTSRVVGDYKDFEGEVQQCYYLFRRMKRDDLALVAARHLWLSRQRFPHDSVIAMMTDDIFADLAVKYDLRRDFFVHEEPRVDTAAIDEESLSKYERLKRKKNRQKKENTQALIFTDLIMENPDFATYLDTHLKPLVSSKDKQSDNESDKLQTDLRTQFVYSPTYTVVSKKSGDINILKSEKNENGLYDVISKVAAKRGINSVDFSDNRLHSMTTSDDYNEWVDLTEWVGEFWQTRGDFDMLFSVQPQMDRIVKKYDAGTVVISLVANRENITGRGVSNALWYAWILPLLPVAVNNMIAHSEATLVYNMQIDVTSAKKLSRHIELYTLSDEKARVASAIYDHYVNIGHDTLSAVPGYMGSRFNIAISPSVGLGTYGMSDNAGSFSFPRTMPFSLGLGIDAEYIILRQAAIHIAADYIPSSIFSANRPYNYSTHLYEAATIYPIDNFRFSVAYRNYKKTAPLGYYWDIGADISLSKETNSKDSKTLGGVHLQVGRSHLFHDHLLFGYFARYTLLFGGNLFEEGSSHTLPFSPSYNNILRFGLNIGLVP